MSKKFLIVTLFLATAGIETIFAQKRISTERLSRQADSIAYSKVCNDSIYSFDVLESYLKQKNISADEVTIKNGLRDIFKRVIIKGKKFPLKDDQARLAWEQEFYNFEYEKALISLKAEYEKKDSMDRNDWSNSNTYLALKLLNQYTIPQVNDSNILLLDKYNVEAGDLWHRYAPQLNVREIWPRNITQPFNSKNLIDEYHVSSVEDVNLKDSDFLRVRDYYIEKIIRNNYFTIESLYRQILEETGYLKKEVSVPLGGSPYWQDKARRNAHALFEIDKNNDRVRELETLVERGKEIIYNPLMEKYFISKSEKFKEDAQKLRDALNYRKSHPLTEGVFRYDDSDIDKTHYIIKEFPYKVQGDSLVVDGTCILHVVIEQYPHATGDWYREYTLNAKVYIKVENGVATSKKVTGLHKLWGRDKRVWDRTRGGILEKAANTLDAKPVVVKTNDMSKMEKNQIEYWLSSRYIEHLMEIPTLENVSIDYLSKHYLEYPDTKYLKTMALPIKNIDMSKLE